jgi:hypothetical protein
LSKSVVFPDALIIAFFCDPARGKSLRSAQYTPCFFFMVFMSFMVNNRGSVLLVPLLFADRMGGSGGQSAW